MTDERLAEIREAIFGRGALTYPLLLSYAQELSAEIDRLRAQTQWQPIETAPRDGRPRLVSIATEVKP